uniref:Uncharacterized protein n=1 Tax=Oryza barthii TaxID=65489 RepID=A0A0D3G616_9ORYZ
MGTEGIGEGIDTAQVRQAVYRRWRWSSQKQDSIGNQPNWWSAAPAGKDLAIRNHHGASGGSGVARQKGKDFTVGNHHGVGEGRLRCSVVEAGKDLVVGKHHGRW